MFEDIFGNNICLGKKDVILEEVKEVVWKVVIDIWIEILLEGYDMIIGG